MGKKILIVDDVYPNRFLLEEIFRDQKVYGAANGDEMRNILQNVTPDVILMDVNLPDEDGFELTKELKNNEKTKDIPVIFVTVHNTKTDVLHAIKSGGADFVTKPFDEKDVRDRVQKVLVQRHFDDHKKKD